MRHDPRCVCLCVFISCLLPNIVLAQDKGPDKPKEQDKAEEAARVLFDAGAKAYAAGLYFDAVAAFREAYKLAPDRPTVLFSLAQAERRQYTVKPDPELLEAAISHFRRYLEIVKEGGRRGDVVIALGELEALRAGAEAPLNKAARIFITTETPGAAIIVDGKKRNQVPVIEEVAPGKHDVTFEAPGFFTEVREILAVEGTIFPLEINLKEKPSQLSVQAPKGASITVDGRIFGEAPLRTPVDLPSGTHRVIVSQRGYVSFDERISIERAQSSLVNVSLLPTTQRKVSYLLFGTSMLALGAGTVMAFVAFDKESDALAIHNEMVGSANTPGVNVDAATLDKYINTLDARDKLAGASTGAFLLAFVVGSAAGATYWFDSSQQRSEGPSMAQFSATPLAGGGFVSVGMRF